MNENNYSSDGAVTAGVEPLKISTDGLPIEFIDQSQPAPPPPTLVNQPPQDIPSLQERLGPSQVAPPMPQDNIIQNELPPRLEPVAEPPMMEQTSFNNNSGNRAPRFFNQNIPQSSAPQQAMPPQPPMMEQPMMEQPMMDQSMMGQPMMEQSMPMFNNNPMNQGMDFQTGMQPTINPDEIFTTGMPPKQKNNSDMYNQQMMNQQFFPDMNQPMMDQQYYPDMNQQPMDQQYYPDMNQPMMDNNGAYNQQAPLGELLPEKAPKMKTQEQIGKAIGLTLVSLVVFELAFLFLLNGAVRDFVTKIFKVSTEIKLIDLTEDSIKGIGRANALYIIISNLFIVGISWLAVRDRFRKTFLSIHDQLIYIVSVSAMSVVLHAVYLGIFWKQTASLLTQFEDYTGFDIVTQLLNSLHNTRIIAVIVFVITVGLSIFVIFKETKKRNKFVNF